GPDGAIYIADWYNPIIQHGEVDFRDPRRDHVHGRIWRVTAKGPPLVPKPELGTATVPPLLHPLSDPEDLTPGQDRRAVEARGWKEGLPALEKGVAELDPKDENVDSRRLEALWLNRAFDAPALARLKVLIASKDYRARSAAYRLVPDLGLLEPPNSNSVNSD